MKRKITIPFVAIILAVAIFAVTSAFKKSPHKTSTDYWIYVPTSTGFNDTSKYQKVTLNALSDENCPMGITRPCVYQEATGSLATKADLYTDLQTRGSDANILSHSLRKKSN